MKPETTNDGAHLISDEEINEHVKIQSFIDVFMKRMEKMFPKSSMFILARDFCKENRMHYSISAEYGNRSELEGSAAEQAVLKQDVFNLFRTSFCIGLLKQPKQAFTHSSTKKLHDAVIDYVSNMGIDVSEYKRMIVPEKSKFVHTMGQKIEFGDNIEEHITELEKELERVKAMRNPETRITMLQAEIKRLRKQGDLQAVANKTIELNKVLDEAKAKREKAERDALIHKMRVANAAKANAAYVEKCRLKREAKAEAERKAKEAEERRKRGQNQFQPHKAAKAKMQKIAERQAEHKKKKSSEGGSFQITRNACSL